MCDVIVREVREGVEGTGVKCGVIGEVGVSYPMTDFERKSLTASAKAQQITSTCRYINIHLIMKALRKKNLGTKFWAWTR